MRKNGMRHINVAHSLALTCMSGGLAPSDTKPPWTNQSPMSLYASIACTSPTHPATKRINPKTAAKTLNAFFTVE